MSKVFKRVKITLKSDLCAASGYAYARIIDSDVVYDKYGLPYIPARRLKGCMKETAQTTLHSLISEGELEELFGKRGQDRPSGFSIDNAYPDGWSDLAGQIDKLKDTQEKVYASPQAVLDQFSAVRAQTAMDENGVVKNNSLRYTRVINHYDPRSDTNNPEEMVFYAPVSFDKEMTGKVEMILKATRSIGLKRNRGLGSVQCELVDAADPEGASWICAAPLSQDEYCVFTYVIRNTAPLVLSGSSDAETERFLNGASILGAFAGKYLSMEGASPDSEAFQDLFLNGNTCFTNAYPTADDKALQIGKKGLFFPAPGYLNKTKKTKEYVNVWSQKDVSAGNQPKKLNGKFVRFDGTSVEEMEALSRNEYHHTSRLHSADQKNTELYVLEVLSEGQLFAGQIYTKGKYVELLKDLFNGLRLGKSKTVQYGLCELVGGRIEPKSPELIHYEEGTSIAVTLLSDGIFAGDSGLTVYADEVTEILAKSLGITIDALDKRYPIIQTKVCYGYQTKWNLRRQPVPAIAAGSSFVFHLAKDADLPEYAFTGEWNQEGHGFVQICKLPECDFSAKEQGEETKESSTGFPDGYSPIFRKIRNKMLLSESKANDRVPDGELKITSSALGRVTLMLKESMEVSNDPQVVYTNFVKRIDSIKSKAKKEEIQRTILKTVGKNDTLWADKLMHQLTMKKYRDKIGGSKGGAKDE